MSYLVMLNVKELILDDDCSHVTLNELLIYIYECTFYCPQMQHSRAAPLSLSVKMGGVSPAGGFVMELMIVVMEVMSCRQPAVCYVYH